MIPPHARHNRILIWMCTLIAVTAVAATAVLLVAVAVLFARFAPEPYRAGV
jgi:hypothetical protein